MNSYLKEMQKYIVEWKLNIEKLHEGVNMNLETANLMVEGMSCSHCVKRIEESLGRLGGVSQVNVDLTSKKVVVEYDPQKVDMQILKTTIEEQGYEVK